MNYHSFAIILLSEYWSMLVIQLWLATLFTLVTWALSTLVNRGNAQRRYLIWRIALINFIFPYALLNRLLNISILSLLNQNVIETVQPQLITPVIKLIQLPATPILTNNSANLSNDYIYLSLLFIWLSGTIVLFSRGLISQFKLALLIKRTQYLTSGRAIELLAELSHQFKIKRSIDLVTSDEIKEVAIVGVWQPKILLPISLCQQMSDEELRIMFIHEIIHAQRWDNLIKNIQMIICALFWFHPLVWLINKKLSMECELSCDERVLAQHNHKKVYATMLLKVARFYLSAQSINISYAARTDLQRRIENIMQEKSSMRFGRLLTGVMVTLLIVNAVIFSAINVGPAIAQNKINKEQSTELVVIMGRLVSSNGNPIAGKTVNLEEVLEANEEASSLSITPVYIKDQQGNIVYTPGITNSKGIFQIKLARRALSQTGQFILHIDLKKNGLLPVSNGNLPRITRLSNANKIEMGDVVVPD